MGLRHEDRIGRSLALLVAGVSWFGLAGCEKSSEQQEAGVSQLAPVAVVAESGGEKEATPPRRAAASRDGALAARVNAALAADARMKTFAIDIRAKNGTVDLFGTVDSAENRDKAAQLAAGVEGVHSVRNHIVLVSGS